MRERFPRLRLRQQPGGADVLELVGEDDAFPRFLIDAYYADPNRSKLDFKLISRLRSEDPFTLTFDARRAAQDRTLDFLSIHHLFVRAMVGDLADAEGPLPTAALEMPNWDGDPGFFFVFELDMRAMRREIEFVATVVDAAGKVDETRSESFLQLARQARTTSVDATGLLTDEGLDRAVAAARAWVGERVTEREADLKRLHDDVLDSKLESLRQGAERRKLWVTHQLTEARDDRIVRMRRGQLTNIDEDYERKRRELEERRGVDVGYGLVAGGVLVGSSAPSADPSVIP